MLAERAALLGQSDLAGGRLARTLSGAADAWLASLLGQARGVALVAVGGYGRRELAPGSDLDVVLLHDGRRSGEEVAALAERVWYPVWDAGVPLDHSVRTIAEALAVAADDLKAAMGLHDARTVAGDAGLGAELRRAARERWRAMSPRRFEELEALARSRHRQAGDVAHALEPELRDGHGGLRDVQLLDVLHSARPEVLGSLPDDVGAAGAVLLDARVELHRTSGRRGDRLLAQDRSLVAERLGLGGPDELLRAVSAAGRVVAVAADDAWARLAASAAQRRGRWGSSRVRRPEPAGAGLVVVGAEVALAAGAEVAVDPSIPVRAAAVAAGRGLPLSVELVDRCRAATPPPPDPWPPELRAALVDLLAEGETAVGPFEALDRAGLVERLLPEWGRVRHLAQHNPFHRFTVDRHLLECAVRAASLARSVDRPDLLLLGSLLHDIGKGWPGDHTEAGIDVVAAVGPRLGLPAADVATLVDLVRLHLVLPDAATRREVRDPATVAEVARAVASPDLLELLAALVEADGLATGPSAWSPWKAGLVADLVERVRRHLGGAPPPPEPTVPQQHLALAAGPLPAVLVDGDDVVVAAPDQPGLFARIAGTLTLHGLDVVAARASTSGAVALDTFTVRASTGRPADAEALRSDLALAMARRIALDARIEQRAATYGPARHRHAAAAAAGPATAPPRAVFVDDASASAAVVEVRARDEIGLLYRIARTLSDRGLDIRAAHVQTLGHEVVDVFYVTDHFGGHPPRRQLKDAVAAVQAELDRRAGREPAARPPG